MCAEAGQESPSPTCQMTPPPSLPCPLYSPEILTSTLANLTGYYCFVLQQNLESYLQALSNRLTPPEPFHSRSPLSLPASSPIEEGGCEGPTSWKGWGSGGWAPLLARGIARKE